MNKLTTTLFLFLLLPLALSTHAAGGKTGETYFLGVAQSFQDSTIYLTDVVALTGIAYDKKTKSPLNIEMYTDQLSKYISGEGHKGYICTTYTARDRKHIEKIYLKLKKRTIARHAMRIVPLSPSEFSYQAVDPTTIYRNTPAATTTTETQSSSDNP